MARFTSDGLIEFLGRVDFQVKVRGFRIELGEIETVLLKHPKIKECVVTAQNVQENLSKLTAYIVYRENIELQVTALNDFLKEYLPEYMIPHYYIRLDKLPLSENGKIDRKKLPDVQFTNMDKGVYYAPVTATEEIVERIWCEILELSRISIHEDFFELGGHSLLAARIFSRIRKVFQVELPIKYLFQDPTIHGLSQHIETWKRKEKFKQIPPIVSVDRSKPVPLSFSQQRLWFLDNLEGSVAYNIFAALEISGLFDEIIFEKVMNTIVSRHEILRTNFSLRDGEPVQTISESSSVTINKMDLRHLNEVQCDQIIFEEARREVTYSFNLEHEPLLHILLLRKRETVSILFLNIHHIISDGWSLGVLVNEISILYSAYSKNSTTPLPPLPIQYGDFAFWQRRHLNDTVLSTQSEYWKKQLQDAPSLLELPTDYPRPAEQTFNGSTEKFEVDAESTRLLHLLCKNNGITLFMALISMFGFLLSRYSRQRDLLIGTPVANRGIPEIEQLMGFFVNTLVIRLRFPVEIKLKELFEQVRQTTLDAYSNQDLPFENLVEELGIERTMSHNPLFQVMFALQNMNIKKIASEEFSIRPLDFPSVTAKFDITCIMTESDGVIKGEWEYNTNLFNKNSILNMIEHFKHIISLFTSANNQQVLASFSIASENELSKIRIWNSTEIQFKHDKTFNEIFHEQVKLNPDKLAAYDERQTTTYAELFKQSEKVKNCLISNQVITGDMIVLFMDRSVNMLSSIIGVLKSGGIYVPIDPEYPELRIQQIFSQSSAKVVIADKIYEEIIRKYIEKIDSQNINLITIDNIITDEVREAEGNPLITPEHCAYCIFTSGSTGIPKGVLVKHKGLTNHLNLKIKDLQINNEDILLQQSSQCFDISVWQFLAGLCAGATVRIVGKEEAHDVGTLCRIIDEESITIVQLVPSLIHIVLEEINRKGATQKPDFSSVKYILSTGEALPSNLCDTWLDIFPEIPMVNAYGPSECSDDVSHFIIRNKNDYSQISVSIGTPVDNTQIYILDDCMNIVPPGVPGELCIGGKGVGQGYKDRPGITADKFVPDPFGSDYGSRIYRSGDLCKWGEDGKLYFLARIDFQVKLRGYRIELGEIESVLRSHPDVKECVVLCIGDIPEKQKLVAFISSTSTANGLHESLLSIAESKLANYMVPSHFEIMPSLPVLPNGKVNRKALPELLSEMDNKDRSIRSPRNQTEQLLLTICQDVLAVNEIGIEDNFFELGGHSLLAIKAISRIREIFNIEIPLRVLFLRPTIIELAAHIDKNKNYVEKSIPLIRQVSSDSLQQLSFSQESMLLVIQNWELGDIYNMNYVFRITGDFDYKIIEKCIQVIINRHTVLKSNFITLDDKLFVKTNNVNQFTLPVVEVQFENLEKETEEIYKITRREAGKNFDLEKDLLVKGICYKVNDRKYYLLFMVHHIVSDGYSQALIVKEITELYKAFLTGTQPALPEIPLQYGDFALWQRKVIDNSVIEDFAKEIAAKINEVPGLFKRDHAQWTYDGKQRQFRFPEGSAEKIEQFARKSGLTPFVVYLSAFSLTLMKKFSRNRILINTPVVNRRQLELEQLVGLFVENMLVDVFIEKNIDKITYVKAVLNSTISAFRPYDLPLSKICEIIPDLKIMANNQLNEVMFNQIDEEMVRPFTIDKFSIEPIHYEYPELINVTTLYTINCQVMQVENNVYGAFIYKDGFVSDDDAIAIVEEFIINCEDLTKLL